MNLMTPHTSCAGAILKRRPYNKTLSRVETLPTNREYREYKRNGMSRDLWAMTTFRIKLYTIQLRISVRDSCWGMTKKVYETEPGRHL